MQRIKFIDGMARGNPARFWVMQPVAALGRDALAWPLKARALCFAGSLGLRCLRA
jgi:hypothetical protein